MMVNRILLLAAGVLAVGSAVPVKPTDAQGHELAKHSTTNINLMVTAGPNMTTTAREPPSGHVPYTKFCYDCSMYNGHNTDSQGHLLSCRCINREKETGWEEPAERYHLHLDDGLGNDIGNFAMPSARHRRTCNDFNLVGSIFHGRCLDTNGNRKPTSINLADHISYEGRFSQGGKGLVFKPY